MAFWLDPAHQPMPIELQFGRAVSPLDSAMFERDALGKPVRLPGNGNGPLDLQLPPGITRVVPLYPQNALQVTGTPSGLSALEKLLPTLDVPLVQYEIEARFLELDRAALSETGLKFEPMAEENADVFGSVTALPLNFGARINQLVEAKRARLLTAPRVTLIDGLGAELKQTLSTSVAWNETSIPHPVDATTNKQTPQRIAYVQSSVGLRTSATRRADGLIALAIEPRLGTRILSVRATVREDQPFAIQMSPSTDARQIIVIVTPHRVRRAGETN